MKRKKGSKTKFRRHGKSGNADDRLTLLFLSGRSREVKNRRKSTYFTGTMFTRSVFLLQCSIL